MRIRKDREVSQQCASSTLLTSVFLITGHPTAGMVRQESVWSEATCYTLCADDPDCTTVTFVRSGPPVLRGCYHEVAVDEDSVDPAVYRDC